MILSTLTAIMELVTGRQNLFKRVSKLKLKFLSHKAIPFIQFQFRSVRLIASSKKTFTFLYKLNKLFNIQYLQSLIHFKHLFHVIGLDTSQKSCFWGMCMYRHTTTCKTVSGALDSFGALHLNSDFPYCVAIDLCTNITN